MKDDVIKELWQIKDELAREVNYDVHIQCQELREEQAASRERIVDRSGGQTGGGPRQGQAIRPVSPQ